MFLIVVANFFGWPDCDSNISPFIGLRLYRLAICELNGTFFEHDALNLQF
jgi:hypothetical protein